MPGVLVHLGANVSCLHQGVATPTSFNLRVRVSGKPVVTLTNKYAVAGCRLAAIPAPSCLTARWNTGAIRVRAGGDPVVLGIGLSVCDQTLAPLVVKTTPPTQTRVTGI